MKQLFDRITINPNILLGKPVIRGTRIPVYVVVNLVAQGKDTAYVRTQYPNLTKEDVTQAIAYAAWSTRALDDAFHMPHV
jgi:uncharacterized protein (DUF433 family)